MFDDAKVVEKKGTVKELQWTNPHVWLQVVIEENGKKPEWSLEGQDLLTYREGRIGDPATIPGQFTALLRVATLLES